MNLNRLCLAVGLAIPASAFAAAGSGGGLSTNGVKPSAVEVSPSDIIEWQKPRGNGSVEAFDGNEPKLGFTSGYVFHDFTWSAGGEGIAAGLSYQLLPDFRVSFGGYQPGPEDRRDPAMPMLFLDWRMGDHWSLRTANGVRLSYDVSADQRHLLSADLAWETDTFSYIAPWGGWPLEPEHEPAVRASLAWQWNLGHHFALRPEVSYRFARSVEFRGSGTRAEEPTASGAFAIGATVSARF